MARPFVLDHTLRGKFDSKPYAECPLPYSIAGSSLARAVVEFPLESVLSSRNRVAGRAIYLWKANPKNDQIRSETSTSVNSPTEEFYY